MAADDPPAPFALPLVPVWPPTPLLPPTQTELPRRPCRRPRESFECTMSAPAATSRRSPHDGVRRSEMGMSSPALLVGRLEPSSAPLDESEAFEMGEGM
jgi:hypothetical protein